MLKKIPFLFLSLTTIYLLLTTYSYGLDLNSPRFKIEQGTVQDYQPDDKKEEVIYTIESLYGKKALQDLRDYGYFINSEPQDSVNLTLSQSLITLSDPGTGQTLGISSKNKQNKYIDIKIIQEYPLKNYSDDRLKLKYSLADTNDFQSLPIQSANSFPRVIFSENNSLNETLTFKIDSPPSPPEGTFETVVNFLAHPQY